MLYLANVRDYIKTISSANNYYIGKLDNKKDKSVVKEVQIQYQKKGEPKTLKTNAQLRSELYKNGFTSTISLVFNK